MKNICIQSIYHECDFLRRNLRLEIKLILNRDVEGDLKDTKNFEAIILMEKLTRFRKSSGLPKILTFLQNTLRFLSRKEVRR